jgi:hypothetical protein
MRRKLTFNFVTVLLALAFLSLSLNSQSLVTGAIEGKVFTDTGEGLPSARVILNSKMIIAGQIEKLTDKNGNFRFTLLHPGV